VLAVTIPERPGSFREFCKLLGKRQVTEFNYRYSDCADRAHLRRHSRWRIGARPSICLAELKHRRIEAHDLSDNELAKLHVRHLVGGHAPSADNEILYRFEFPERPGALMTFLNSMSRGWNISLFHYRNHGADYGRVLVGMQVPPSDKAEFRAFLVRLGYDCVEETDNPRTGCSSAASSSGGPAADGKGQGMPQNGSPAPAKSCSAATKKPGSGRRCRFRQTLCSVQPSDPVANLSGRLWPTIC
jgi:hypothetical protein